MRQVTEIKTIYKFNTAPDKIKEKIRDFLSVDLYEHNMIERIETLKKVAEILNGKLDYSLSCVPDRGEFISIKPSNMYELDYTALWELIDVEKDCPLTGHCYDHGIIDQLTKYSMTDNNLNNILNNYIKSIHDEFESMLKDEYLSELCEANEYEFYSNGTIY